MAIPVELKPPFLSTVLSTEDVTTSQSVVIDLGSNPIRLSVQSNVVDVTTSAVQDFIDGVRASATITVVDYTALTGATLTVNGTILTEGVEWTAAVDNDTTAVSLEAAVEAVTGISSTVATNVITAQVTLVGTAGNAFTLATSDAVNLTVSGATFSGGVNTDINDATEVITLGTHGWITGQKVNFTVVAGVAPTGLVNATNYWVILVSSTTIKLATTLANAVAGTAINLTGNPAGAGDFDLTPATAAYDYDIDASNDNVYWGTVSVVASSGTGTTTFFDQFPTPTSRYLRITVAPTGGEVDVEIIVHSKF